MNSYRFTFMHFHSDLHEIYGMNMNYTISGIQPKQSFWGISTYEHLRQRPEMVRHKQWHMNRHEIHYKKKLLPIIYFTLQLWVIFWRRMQLSYVYFCDDDKGLWENWLLNIKYGTDSFFTFIWEAQIVQTSFTCSGNRKIRIKI